MPTFGVVAPEYQTAKLGETVLISCSSAAFPKWYRNDKEVILWNLLKTITLLDVKEEDSGEYVCHGTNYYLLPFKATAELWVGSVSSYRAIFPKQQVLYVGQLLAIMCNSAEKVLWYKNGKILTNLISGLKKTFIVQETNEADAGNYTCLGLTETEKPFEVQAEVLIATYKYQQIWPPRISPRIGDTIKLECSSVADRRWYYSNTASTPNQLPFSSDNTIYLRNITWDNAGYYYCYGLHSIHTSLHFLSVATVTILEQSLISPLELTVNSGMDAEFKCNGSGKNKWIVNLDRNLKPNVKTLNDGRLIRIRIAKNYNEGFYECYGRNNMNKLFYAFARLTVLDKEETVHSDFPKEEEAIFGDLVRFRCTSTYPSAWKFKKGTLPHNTEEKKSGGHNLLVIRDFKQKYAGKYNCSGYTNFHKHNISKNATYSFSDNGSLTVKKVQCQKPTLLHGVTKYEGIGVGETAFYRCHEDYVLLANQNRICRPQGEWSGFQPTCVNKRNISDGALRNTVFLIKYFALLIYIHASH